MFNYLLRSLSMLGCILLVHSVSFAQETTKPTEEPKPKEQPLDKPTEVKETPKEQEPKIDHPS